MNYFFIFVDVNLKIMVDMCVRFDVIVGVFDYIMGFIVFIIVIVLGVRVIEKYFILDRLFGGLDLVFLMEFREFFDMVESVC